MTKDKVQLNKLGNDQWEKSAPQSGRKKVRDVAADELLEVYAQREAKPGYAFQVSAEDHDPALPRVSRLPKTDDQLDAIAAVLADMQLPRAMDRLVCGDVGFGKTEGGDASGLHCP